MVTISSTRIENDRQAKNYSNPKYGCWLVLDPEDNDTKLQERVGKETKKLNPITCIY